MERLDDSDFVYFKTAMDGASQAQSIVNFVQSVLMQRYGLKEGDQITPDGQIIRLETLIHEAPITGSTSEDDQIIS